MVEPYWEVSKYTGYGRALDISVRDIYGIEKIDRSSIEDLNHKFLKSLFKGHFNKILKEYLIYKGIFCVGMIAFLVIGGIIFLQCSLQAQKRMNKFGLRFLFA